ncbi:hypothetical protein Golax_011620 [Gossypium laxum]|uniref:Uncharacterized protein n=1 Tax=Gossypium laxum TaxID=34288 RepID=A0A7J8ZL33_9ROSI|nr:hypothetical protein [Gossypium laxum]
MPNFETPIIGGSIILNLIGALTLHLSCLMTLQRLLGRG